VAQSRFPHEDRLPKMNNQQLSSQCNSGKCGCALAKLNGHRHDVLCRGRFLTLPKKTVLYEQRTRYGGVYLVCSGQLKLVRRLESGQGQMIAVASQGDAIGLELAMEDGGKHYDHYAATLTACCLFNLAEADFKALLAYPDFAQAMLRCSLRTLQSHQKHLYQVLGRGVRSRLWHSVCHWARRFGQSKGDQIELDLGLLNEDWANWVGSIPQSVSREFSKLQKRGWLTRRSKKILLNSETSSQLLQDQDRVLQE